MDERELIRKFAQNEEEIQLGKRVLDLARRAERSWFSCTDFLTPSEAAFSAALCSGAKISYLADGGYDGAQRQLFLFGDGAALRDEDGPIVALRLESPVTFGHRDVLGSILGLGLRREKLGDILIGDNDTVLFCRRDILPYLLSNLERIGSAPVRPTQLLLADIVPPEPKLEAFTVSVASLRLDAVLAAAAHLSREEAQQQIRRGLVQLDYRAADSPSKTLAARCVISLRGFGKFRLAAVAGETRKGKVRLELEKYV